jgi:hypothetical protein
MKIKGIAGGILLLRAGIFAWMSYQGECSKSGMLLDPSFSFLVPAWAVIGIALIVLAILQHSYGRGSGDSEVTVFCRMSQSCLHR